MHSGVTRYTVALPGERYGLPVTTGQGEFDGNRCAEASGACTNIAKLISIPMLIAKKRSEKNLNLIGTNLLRILLSARTPYKKESVGNHTKKIRTKKTRITSSSQERRRPIAPAASLITSDKTSRCSPLLIDARELPSHQKDDEDIQGKIATTPPRIRRL